MRQSELLSRALQRAQRMGDVLVKHEAAEEQQIAALAEELIQREYSMPARERPCQAEAQTCLECYQQHADDPTPCAEAVSAYSACARHASASILQAKP